MKTFSYGRDRDGRQFSSSQNHMSCGATKDRITTNGRTGRTPGAGLGAFTHVVAEKHAPGLGARQPRADARPGPQPTGAGEASQVVQVSERGVAAGQADAGRVAPGRQLVAPMEADHLLRAGRVQLGEVFGPEVRV